LEAAENAHPECGRPISKTKLTERNARKKLTQLESGGLFYSEPYAELPDDTVTGKAVISR